MDAHNISIEVGTRKVLHTAGTYCDRDIAIVATGDNYDKGYDAGHKAGYNEGYTEGLPEGYTEGYADGARDGRDVGYEIGWNDGHSDGYQEGYTAGYDGGYDEGQYDGIVSGIEMGKKAEYDTFWNMFQENGNRTDYRYAFAYTKWNDESFNPKYPLKFVGDATCAFLSTEFVWADKVLRVDLSEATYLYWTFRNNKFTHLGKCDLSSATNITGIFSLCFNLKSIEEIVSHEGLPWGDAFTYDASLEDITFSGVIGKSISLANSSKLTTASVQSIIDHLKDLTGQTAQTLTFHADVKGKLTDAQKAAITAKNWQLG